MNTSHAKSALSMAVQLFKFFVVAVLFYSYGNYNGERKTLEAVAALAALSQYDGNTQSMAANRLVLRQCALLPGNRYIDLVIENTGSDPVRDVRAVVACFNFRSNLVETVPASIDIIPPGVRWDSTLEIDPEQGIKAVQLLSLVGS